MTHSPDKARLHAQLDLEAWWLSKVEGLSNAEISARTGVSTSRAMVRAKRGRERARTLAFLEVGSGPGFKAAAPRPRRFTWRDFERELTA